jgi:hypothetical protein
MPSENPNQPIWKSLAAGLIICCAFAIMMPDLIKYLFSISRLLLLIALIFVGAGVIGLVSTRRIREKIRKEGSQAAPQLQSEPEPSEEMQ